MDKNKNKLRAKFLGCIIGSAVCEQLGAAGQRYTDDTVIMIGVTESLIENRGFNAYHLAKIFLDKLNDSSRVDIYLEKSRCAKMLLNKRAKRSFIVSELGNTVEAFNSVPISIFPFLAISSIEATLD